MGKVYWLDGICARSRNAFTSISKLALSIFGSFAMAVMAPRDQRGEALRR